MASGRFLSLRAVELLVVAVIGGALALGGAALLGKLGGGTTIEEVSTPAPTTSVGVRTGSASAATRGLTAEKIYANDAPGVVQITATTTSASGSDPFNVIPGTPQTSESLGSGFVIDKDGHIVTNYHVIAGAQKVQVSFSGRDQMPARVVGEDKSTDVAILKIDAHARALTPVPLGNSDGVVVGDPVYAIGNPFGFTRTLTTGVVSAVQREIEAPNSLPIDHAIQTDAAINHGNSGGPLIDASGRVIGVTSQISTGSTGQQGNVGIGFAIPINTVRDVASQIIATGKVQHAFLGVSSAPVTAQLKRLFHLPTAEGLLVQTIDPASGAAKAGIAAGRTRVVVGGESYQVGGDIIVSVDGQQVSTPQKLYEVISQHKPGEHVRIVLFHHGTKKTVTATLGQRPGSS